MEPCDLLVIHASELCTLAGGPRTGAALGRIGIVADGGVAIAGDRIAAVGPSPGLLARYRPRRVLDAANCLVTPGFVDAHTHPVFAATREAEFEMRVQGRTYQEIAAAGGGIRSSVRAVRAASEDDLVASTRRRLDLFLAHGTTTVEAKSGYGLSLADETKSLRAIQKAAAGHPVRVVPTFLGAHEFPDEYRDRREDYVRLLCDEMIPAVARDRLAVYADVFCEKGVFEVPESRRVLEAARDHGLRLRLHADEFVDSGAAALAAELRADSADHLMAVSDRGIDALGSAGTAAVLLPGTSFFLALSRFAPARRLVDAGLTVALGTDFNPGSNMTCSMPMILTIACLYLKLTPAEALTAATINAARSLRLESEVGSLEAGKRADLVIFDAPNHRFLPYHYGVNLVRAVVAAGRVVVDDRVRTASNPGSPSSESREP
ncbi:MAG: imidazolonepropionase [Planctomycetes bacterium]|nr:imidazolonepropionase [Planctomycetota bacterium]MBI3843835.1 imidazolonepropionase [Planctomycetota bacterium]